MEFPRRLPLRHLWQWLRRYKRDRRLPCLLPPRTKSRLPPYGNQTGYLRFLHHLSLRLPVHPTYESISSVPYSICLRRGPETSPFYYLNVKRMDCPLAIRVPAPIDWAETRPIPSNTTRKPALSSRKTASLAPIPITFGTRPSRIVRSRR